jgi:putative lipase involved disintegration of autophagic bodies
LEKVKNNLETNTSNQNKKLGIGGGRSKQKSALNKSIVKSVEKTDNTSNSRIKNVFEVKKVGVNRKKESYKRRRVDESEIEKDSKEIVEDTLMKEQNALLKSEEKEKVIGESRERVEIEGKAEVKNTPRYYYYNYQ